MTVSGARRVKRDSSISVLYHYARLAKTHFRLHYEAVMLRGYEYFKI
jgi:hypothetical protein